MPNQKPPIDSELYSLVTNSFTRLPCAPLATKLTLLDQVQDAVTASVTAAMTLELAKKQGTDSGGS